MHKKMGLFWVIFIVILLSGCVSNDGAYSLSSTVTTSTSELTILESLTPKPKEQMQVNTTTPIATNTPNLCCLELLLTRTPEVENLVPGYKPDRWTIYLISVVGSDLPYAYGDPGFTVHEIEEDGEGVLWMGTAHGLVRYDGRDWEIVAVETQVIGAAHVEIAIDGSVWFTLSSGIYKYSDGNIDLMYELGDASISAMEISPTGEIWIALSSYPLDDILVYRDHNWESFRNQRSLPFRNATDLVIDSKGRVYVWEMTAPPYNSYSSGLAYYENGEWAIFEERDGLYISSLPLIVDEEDHVWLYLSQSGLGLYEFYDDQFHLRAPVFGTGYGLYDPDPMVFDHNGALWFGDFIPGANLAKYVKGTDQIQSIDGYYEFYVDASDADELPVSRYEAENIIPFTSVLSLFVDSKNQLWIGTHDGIFVYNLNH